MNSNIWKNILCRPLPWYCFQKAWSNLIFSCRLLNTPCVLLWPQLMLCLCSERTATLFFLLPPVHINLSPLQGLCTCCSSKFSIAGSFASLTAQCKCHFLSDAFPGNPIQSIIPPETTYFPIKSPCFVFFFVGFITIENILPIASLVYCLFHSTWIPGSWEHGICAYSLLNP